MHEETDEPSLHVSYVPRLLTKKKEKVTVFSAVLHTVHHTSMVSCCFGR